jgi:hypothetical protein
MVKRSNRSAYVKMAEPMIEYYDTYVTNNKKAVKALQQYKYNEYASINQLLLGKPFLEFSLDDILWDMQDGKKDNDNKCQILVRDIQQHLIQVYHKRHVSLVDTIKTIDKLILNAPALVDNVTVYRGMQTDIYDDLECRDKMFYWTSPAFMSTSFSKNVSNTFKSRHGIMFVISVPSETRGLFLPWEIPVKGSIGNSTIDNEYELLLPRGCQFLVESIDYVKNMSYKESSTYKNIPCEKKYPSYTKVYKMRLVSQPSIAELKRNYNRMTKTGKFELKPWDFKSIKVHTEKH